MRPLCMVVPQYEDNIAYFSVSNKLIEVEGVTDQLRKILPLCNGNNSVKKIATDSGYSEEVVIDLLSSLQPNGIIDDCTHAYRLFHRYSSNESPYFDVLSGNRVREIMESPRWSPEVQAEAVAAGTTTVPKLDGLIAKRRSSFPTSSSQLGFKELSSIVAAMDRPTEDYRRSVPSAGALHSLVIHVVLTRPSGDLHAGIWWFDQQSQIYRLCRNDTSGMEELFVRSEESDQQLRNGAAIVFISSDLGRISQKYANRGYRYALLETGAAMQNAYLAAAELDVPIRAIGGFFDEAAQSFLGESGDVVPLLAILLGG